MLLKAGADGAAKDRCGKTPTESAASNIDGSDADTTFQQIIALCTGHGNAFGMHDVRNTSPITPAVFVNRRPEPVASINQVM